MEAKKVIHFCLGFISCLILSYLLTISRGIYRGENSTSQFVYFLLVGLPSAAPYCIIIYAWYFCFIDKVGGIRNLFLRIVSILLFTILTCVIVMYVNWEISKGAFESFEDFFKGINYLLVFTFFTIIQVLAYQIISKIKK